MESDEKFPRDLLIDEGVIRGSFDPGIGVCEGITAHGRGSLLARTYIDTGIAKDNIGPGLKGEAPITGDATLPNPRSSYKVGGGSTPGKAKLESGGKVG